MREWWERRFFVLEPALCAAVFGGLYLWVLKGGPRVLGDALGDNRAAVYGALASILGALLGFVITTVSVVIGFSTTRSLDRLRSSNQYGTLWKVLISTIWWLGIATAGCLVALVVDRPTKQVQVVSHLAIFAVAVAGMRVARTAWVLENIIAIIVKETSKKSSESPTI